MTPTQLLYFDNLEALNCQAIVVDSGAENEKTYLVLDQTVFYPQGGGQPYDQGVITSNNAAKFLVEEVRIVDGYVRHFGKLITGNLNKGDCVNATVDETRRKLHNRLHSAGHLLDLAITQLNLNWVAGKGHHFPTGAYVEYAGNVEHLDKEKLKQDIEDHCNNLIASGRPTTIRFMTKAELATVCKEVPTYLPDDKPARVIFFGDFAIPCGGTHVTNLKHIGKMNIRKIKMERGNIRISYDVESVMSE